MVRRCYKRNVLPHCTSHKSKDTFKTHLWVVRLSVLVLVVVAKCMILVVFLLTIDLYRANGFAVFRSCGCHSGRKLVALDSMRATPYSRWCVINIGPSYTQ